MMEIVGMLRALKEDKGIVITKRIVEEYITEYLHFIMDELVEEIMKEV